MVHEAETPTTTNTMTNSTNPDNYCGRSIHFDRGVGAWIGYSWERVTCFQVDSWAVTEPMTENEARQWLEE